MSKEKIAIIHRYPSLIEFFADVAGHLGYDVLKMYVDKNTTPQQAASFVDGGKPDLVLLAENWQPIQFDHEKLTVGGKEGEGIEALIEIKKNNPFIPIYMISGNPQYEERAMQSGANGYIKIPIGFRELRELLHSQIRS